MEGQYSSSGRGRGAKITRAADMVIPTTIATAIVFTAVVFDTDGFANLADQPTRLTVPAGLAGYYIAGAYGEFDVSTAGGERFECLRLNGTEDWACPQYPPSGGVNNTGLNPTGVRYLNVGDYIETRVSQDTGGNLNWKTFTGVDCPWLYLMRLGS